MNATSICPKPRVSLSKLSFSYPNGKSEILDNLDFTLGQEEICALIGPSGCGKTTLLYLLAGLLFPSSGEVRINGTLLNGPRPKTAVILQDYGLFPWKTVEENIAVALKVRALPKAVIRERVSQVLDSLKMSALGKRYPKALSGGQRQRVAIARALVQEPDLLLMDEPFAALDALTREEMQRVFKELWSAKPFSCMLVTHQVEEALLLGNKVMVLGPSAGQVTTITPDPSSDREGFPFYEQCRELRHLLRGDSNG